MAWESSNYDWTSYLAPVLNYKALGIHWDANGAPGHFDPNTYVNDQDTGESMDLVYMAGPQTGFHNYGIEYDVDTDVVSWKLDGVVTDSCSLSSFPQWQYLTYAGDPYDDIVYWGTHGSAGQNIYFRDIYLAVAGDADGDGRVDSSDLATWQQHYDPLGANDNTFAWGDWNGDGLIDSADLAIWQQNYDPLGIIQAAAPVPEPGSMLLLTCCLMALKVRRKRR